jgi:hypothetical protein
MAIDLGWAGHSTRLLFPGHLSETACMTAVII